MKTNAQKLIDALTAISTDPNLIQMVDSYSGTSLITPDQFVTLDASAREVAPLLAPLSDPTTPVGAGIAGMISQLQAIVEAEKASA